MEQLQFVLVVIETMLCVGSGAVRIQPVPFPGQRP